MAKTKAEQAKELSDIKRVEELLNKLEKELGALGKTVVDPIRKSIMAMSEAPDIKRNIAEIEKKIEDLREQLKPLKGRLETVVELAGMETIEQLLGKDFAENVKQVLGTRATTATAKKGKIIDTTKIGIIYCGQRYSYMDYFVRQFVVDPRYRTPAKFIEYLTDKKIPFEIVEKDGKKYLILNTAVDIVNYKVR